MNEAEGVGQQAIALCPLWEDALAGFVGGAEALFPEGAVDGNVFKLEHAHGDATYLYVSYDEETPVGADYAHYVTLLGATVDMVDGSGEYPGVKTSERLFFSFL